jgi:hypothetical protein
MCLLLIVMLGIFVSDSQEKQNDETWDQMSTLKFNHKL